MLREGNSDRRAPASVKAYAQAHPHSMGAWSKDSLARGDDERRRLPLDGALGDAATRDELRIEFVAADGAATVLKSRIKVQAGEVVDGAVMRARALDAFLAEQIADAKEQGLLFSLHLKATMMKVSDPIIFGHAVRAFFAGVFTEHHDALESSARARTTASARSCRRSTSSADEGDAIRAAIDRRLRDGPACRWWTPTAGSRTCTCRAT